MKWYPQIGGYEPTGDEVEIAKTGPEGSEHKKMNSTSGIHLLDDNPQNIDKTNGNFLVNIRNKLVIAIMNTDDTDSITVTPEMSAVIKEDGVEIEVVEPTIDIAAGETVILGPFSMNYEFADSKIYFNWDGDALDEDILIEAFRIG